LANLKTVVTTSPYDVMSDEDASTALNVMVTKPPIEIRVDAEAIAATVQMAEMAAWKVSVEPTAIGAYDLFIAILSSGGGFRGDKVVQIANYLFSQSIVGGGTRDAAVALTVEEWPQWQVEGLDKEPTGALVAEVRK